MCAQEGRLAARECVRRRAAHIIVVVIERGDEQIIVLGELTQYLDRDVSCSRIGIPRGGSRRRDGRGVASVATEWLFLAGEDDRLAGPQRSHERPRVLARCTPPDVRGDECRAKTDGGKLGRVERSVADQQHGAGDHDAGLIRHAVHEGAHLIAALPRDHVEHRLVGRARDALEVHELSETEGDESAECGLRHEQRRESSRVEQREDEDRGHDAEAREEPVRDEERREERGPGRRAAEQSEEARQLFGARICPRGRLGERKCEREIEHGEEHGRRRDVTPERRGAHVSVAGLHVLDQARAARGRDDVPCEQRTCDEEHEDERAGPDREQVLRAEETRERTGDETTDDAAEDPTGREQGEQALGLARIAHDRRDAPGEHALQQSLDIHEQPEDRIRPWDVERKHDALQRERSREHER